MALRDPFHSRNMAVSRRECFFLTGSLLLAAVRDSLIHLKILFQFLIADRYTNPLKIRSQQPGMPTLSRNSWPKNKKRRN
jgi:hypothetical protein